MCLITCMKYVVNNLFTHFPFSKFYSIELPLQNDVPHTLCKWGKAGHGAQQYDSGWGFASLCVRTSTNSITLERVGKSSSWYFPKPTYESGKMYEEAGQALLSFRASPP